MTQKNKKSKPKKNPGIVVFIVLMVLASAISSFIITRQLMSMADSVEILNNDIFNMSLIILFLYFALFVVTIIHETGHLVFGLLSGYRFVSFRVGSLMLVKVDNKIRLKKFSIAGTGGQCLMSPPDMVDKKIPFKMYNLGGSLMNLLTSVIFLVIALLLKNSQPFLSAIMQALFILGLVTALTNGIPMRLGAIDNDGYNTLSLSKNNEALRSLWVQLRATEKMAQDVRLKDMPQEWFYKPTDEAMKNSLIAGMGVFYCNRLIDEHNFEEAKQYIKKLLDMDSGIVGIYRSLLTCDLIYCELITNSENLQIESFMDKEQKKLIKAMKSNPSVIRTEYAIALLFDMDKEKAKKIMDSFEKTAKTYPYPVDIQSERELIAIANQIKAPTS